MSKILQPMGLVYTPQSWNEIERWVEAFPKKDRANMYIAIFIGWNYAAKLANENHEGPAGNLETAMTYILEEEDE